MPCVNTHEQERLQWTIKYIARNMWAECELKINLIQSNASGPIKIHCNGNITQSESNNENSFSIIILQLQMDTGYNL